MNADSILFPVRGVQIASLLVILYGLYVVATIYKSSNGWKPYLISVGVLLAHEFLYFALLLLHLIFTGFFSRLPSSFNDWSVGLRFHETFVVILILFGMKKHWDRR